MSERKSLLASIAETIADYRDGEIDFPTPDHVDRWSRQFDADVRVPLLREFAHTIGATYLSKETMSGFFRRQIRHKEIAGADPCGFWRKAHLLDIQQNGHSQSDIRVLFADALKKECGIKSLSECGSADEVFVYLDDVLFSGSRIGNDLAEWIQTDAPDRATVHIVVMAAYRFGEWKCMERLREAAAAAKKKISFHVWAALRLENRVRYEKQSEVLWPVVLPDDAALQAYMADEKKFPFKPRTPGGTPEHKLFSSEEGRQLLEREFLMAGMRIRSFSQNPSRALRPLGFSPFGLGFGSTIVTYRNCPNNSPLALWWGDPAASKGHPFSKWYPLVPRKTYDSEDGFDDVF